MCTTVHRCGDMHTKRQSGFTLVELAVVVFLVGLLASVGLSALNAQMTSASISATKKKQEIIKDALIAYLGTNKRLPCPAIDNTGQESRVIANAPAGCTHTGAVTTGYFGILPYATLGLSKSTALDGQENFFSYAVSNQWTLTYSTAAPVTGGTSTSTAIDAFNVGILGTLIINDRSPTTPYTETPISPVAAAAFIVSHGKNGLGARTSKWTQNVLPASGTDELKNVPVSTTWLAPAAFYQRGYTDNPISTFGAFDDVALTLNPNDLITPLVKDGALKSAESQWSEQVASIKSAIVGYMFSPTNSGTCAPPASSTVAPIPSSTFATVLTNNNIPLTDPWGASITYANPQKICKLKKDPILKIAAPTNCFTTSDYSNTAVAVYTITSPQGGTVIGPTYDQLIANYPNPLGNCP